MSKKGLKYSKCWRLLEFQKFFSLSFFFSQAALGNFGINNAFQLVFANFLTNNLLHLFYSRKGVTVQWFRVPSSWLKYLSDLFLRYYDSWDVPRFQLSAFIPVILLIFDKITQLDNFDRFLQLPIAVTSNVTFCLSPITLLNT